MPVRVIITEPDGLNPGSGFTEPGPSYLYTALKNKNRSAYGNRWVWVMGPKIELSPDRKPSRLVMYKGDEVPVLHRNLKAIFRLWDGCPVLLEFLKLLPQTDEVKALGVLIKLTGSPKMKMMF
jgi:hypothetical protein